MRNCEPDPITDSSLIFALSLNPLHRRAAQRWIGQVAKMTLADFFFAKIAEKSNVLPTMFHLCETTLPGTGVEWRGRPLSKGPSA